MGSSIKQQFNVKLDPELQRTARLAAEELGQEIGVFVARALEAHIKTTVPARRDAKVGKL